MKLRNLLIAFSVISLLGSCAAPKSISYFQDLTPGVSELHITKAKDITIKPKDKLSILVNSQDPRLTSLFNLPILSQQVGVDNNYAQSRGLSGYTVDKKGCIDFPVLGEIKVLDMTREEVDEMVLTIIDRINVIPRNEECMKLEIKLKTGANRDFTYVRGRNTGDCRSGHICKKMIDAYKSGMKS